MYYKKFDIELPKELQNSLRLNEIKKNGRE